MFVIAAKDDLCSKPVICDQKVATILFVTNSRDFVINRDRYNRYYSFTKMKNCQTSLRIFTLILHKMLAKLIAVVRLL
jgi:hypothetical protein